MHLCMCVNVHVCVCVCVCLYWLRIEMSGVVCMCPPEQVHQRAFIVMVARDPLEEHRTCLGIDVTV